MDLTEPEAARQAPLYATERQQRILAEARSAGRVEVAATARDLGVTPETIRKDLQRLEDAGVVRRVHGGAIPVERLSLEREVTTRLDRGEEKTRIARAALEHLPANGAIFIESGSTTQRLAELLPADRELVVVTNSLPIALALVPRPGITVITIGGRVRSVTLGSVDHIAIRSLGELFVDVAFLGTNAISVQHGLTTPDSAEAEVKRAMLRAASTKVLLADSSKVGTHLLWKYGTLADIDVLVTDSGLEPEHLDGLRAAGPTVHAV